MGRIMNVWVVRADFGRHADNFRNGGYVALDYGISEPYPVGRPREAFIKAYKKFNPSVTNNKVVGQQVGQITRFCEDMQVGDYVITPSDNNDVLYYGKVLDEPYYFESAPSDSCPYRHRRNVRWSTKTASRSTFSVPFRKSLRSSLTMFSVSQASEFLTAIDADGYEPPEAAPDAEGTRQRDSHISIPPEAAPDAEVAVVHIEPYSVDDILKDGCFISRGDLEKILERLRTKKNLILQGPPGTGKTWLAKRLAFALMEQRCDSKIRPVQFHPNLSYEDFIRGWRPAGDGRLTLMNGPFVEMIKTALNDPESKYVVLIEEINRGNPAQIFGEMLTLLEVDKRTPNEALELSYRESDGERVFIPDNLYVIGTMNIADRSLALVDLALRRRFAFIDLEPEFGEPWRTWVQSQHGIGSEVLVEIEKRLIALNEDISVDTSLGPQFRVGHSYVTPPSGISINNAYEWFRQVVKTEIGPLLDEYWFDDLDKSRKARERLLEGV